MKIPAGNGYFIEIEDIRGLGSTWIVRVYRKSFLRKKLITSDWFLNEEQAKRFADDVARELHSNGTLDMLRERTPGWTLHKPDR